MATYDSFAAPEQFRTNSDPAKDATSATAHRQPDGIGESPTNSNQPVSQDRQAEAGTPLTEEARELAIAQAEAAEARHDVRWVLTGCFAAKGDADRARRSKELLIAGRSKPA